MIHAKRLMNGKACQNVQHLLSVSRWLLGNFDYLFFIELLLSQSKMVIHHYPYLLFDDDCYGRRNAIPFEIPACLYCQRATSDSINWNHGYDFNEKEKSATSLHFLDRICHHIDPCHSTWIPCNSFLS